MAFRYIDYNGITVGFGTFNRFLNLPSNPFQFNLSNDGQGTTNTDANGSFSHTYAFGSLFTGANTATGTLTMNGTWDFAANGFYLQGTFTNAAVDQVINRTAGTGSMTLGGTNPFIEVSTTDRKLRFLDWPLKGGVNWEKRGVGTLELGAANEFSAGVTISAGTLQIGNASALGTGTVTMIGGKLSSSSTTGYTVANALTLNGTMTLGDATNTGALTVNGVTNIVGNSALTVASSVTLAGQMTGSGTLTKSGSSTLFLTGTGNDNNGTFTISAGSVQLASFANGTPNQLGSVGTIALGTAGNISYTGNTTYASSSNITGSGSAGIVVRNTSATGLTFNSGAFSSSTYTGSFTLYADGNEAGVTAQTVSFNGNGWTGMQYAFLYNGSSTNLTQTFKYAGTATATMANALYLQTGSATQRAVLHASSSGNIAWSGIATILGSSAAMTLDFKNDSTGVTTFSGAISDGSFTLNVAKTGTGTATLSGSNTYKGTVSVSTGTLNANSTTALGSTSGGAITVTSGATLSLGAAPTYSTRSLAISGTGVSSTVGALVINNTGTSAFQSITLGGTTYIRATNSGSINAPFTSNNNSVVFGASAGSDFIPFASLSNVFSGTGSVTYGGHSLDTGIVRADVRHTYTGNTTLAYGTTYVNSSLETPGTDGPLGNKSLTAANTLLMTGGILFYIGGSVDYSGRFSTAGNQQWRINTNSSSVTFSSSLQGNSSLSLLGGALSLSGDSRFSSFTGGVNLVDGTLTLNAPVVFVGFSPNSSPIGISGTITFTGGTLQYTASNNYDYSPRFSTNASQQWKIDTNGQTVAFSSALNSTGGSLVVSGGGTLILGVANSYTNGTTLSLSTLKCLNASSLGTGGFIQGYSSTLHVATVDGKLTIAGAHTNTGTGSRIIRIGAA